MLKSKWLVLCMLIGLASSVALISSIPLYTQAILQKSLIKEMENYQKDNKKFTGGYIIQTSMETTKLVDKKISELEEKGEAVLQNTEVEDYYKNLLQAFKKQDKYAKEVVEKKIGLPALAKVNCYALNKMKVESESGASKNNYASLNSLSSLDKHITLIDGKMPAIVENAEVYEVLVSDAALRKLNLVLGKVIVLQNVRTKWKIEPIKVKPVGVFAVKDNSDPYWTYFNPDNFDESFFLDEELLEKDFIEKTPHLLYFIRWYYAFDYHALKDINLLIKPRMLTVLRGRSGSGKTTLLNILGALDKPKNGAVHFNENNICKMNESNRDILRKKLMGFIFQSVALIPIMTAYENVEFGLRVADFNSKERKQRAVDCLNFVGLQKRMSHRTHELSGGEQQRVAIARAIAHKPDVIFADEPTAQLDTHMGLQVMKIFRELIEREGLTIVMTSHDPNIIELADMVYTLEDGQIVNE